MIPGRRRARLRPEDVTALTSRRSRDVVTVAWTWSARRDGGRVNVPSGRSRRPTNPEAPCSVLAGTPAEPFSLRHVGPHDGWIMMLVEPTDLDRAASLMLEAHAAALIGSQVGDDDEVRSCRTIVRRASWFAAHAIHYTPLSEEHRAQERPS